jgi:tripartite-type tricarboxylate transporter receptor subunit TctC
MSPRYLSAGLKRVFCLVFLLIQTFAIAEQYPDHPIALVIPYPAGSSTNDILGRLLAKKLSEKIGQQVVPENRPGASGNLGSMFVAKSPANGYTLLVGVAAPLAVGPNVYKNLGYDPIKDLSAVAMFASTPYVMVVNSNVPANNSRELLALAKLKPNALNFASSGVGGTPHLCGELFKALGGAQMTHIPYKGAADAMTDLLSGRVEVFCTGFTALEEYIKSGRLKPIGIATSKRSDLLPNLPTFEEQGLAGFQVNSWTGLFAPAKTPESLVKKLSQEVQKITNDPQVRAILLKQGSEPMYMDPDQLGFFLKAETAKWGALVKTAGMIAE